MAIGSAVERGSTVYVYDEKGRQIMAKPRGTQANDGLKGYTGSTVSIRHGNTLYTFNERGSQISATPAG